MLHARRKLASALRQVVLAGCEFCADLSKQPIQLLVLLPKLLGKETGLALVRFFAKLFAIVLLIAVAALLLVAVVAVLQPAWLAQPAVLRGIAGNWLRLADSTMLVSVSRRTRIVCRCAAVRRLFFLKAMDRVAAMMAVMVVPRVSKLRATRCQVARFVAQLSCVTILSIVEAATVVTIVATTVATTAVVTTVATTVVTIVAATVVTIVATATVVTIVVTIVATTIVVTTVATTVATIVWRSTAKHLAGALARVNNARS
jgi:hypothetical protein